MAVHFNTGDTGNAKTLLALKSHMDGTYTKPGIKNTPVLMNTNYINEDAQIEIAGDLELSDTEEPVEDVKPNVIGEPREVTVGVTEAQQETIDNMVENVMNHYGAKDVLDNVMYKDENGNPKSQVITHKNEDGTYSKTTITYNEDGKIAKAAVTKCSDEKCENVLDGYYTDFEYNDDGTIKAQSNYGWTNKSGAKLDIMVYNIPTIIAQDGSTKIEEFGLPEINLK